MRCVLMALALIALSSPVSADECSIIWWDLFLPQSEVEFEKTSEVSVLLTLQNTVKSKPFGAKTVRFLAVKRALPDT